MIALLLSTLGIVIWLSPMLWNEEGEIPIVAPDEPLVLDQSVRMRWVDEETGEEDVWQITKREGAREVWEGRPLPEGESDAPAHVPDESSRALSAMGMESWRNGEIVVAMESLSAAIDADPDDPLPRTQYGRMLALAMSYEEALIHLERAAELRPEDPQVWLDLATVHEKTRSLNRSWEARRRAKALAEEQEIRQGEMGFWVVGDNSIYP
jgi:tetratricopeptide (TPR) repeat protein